jgi:hypothetical protein
MVHGVPADPRSYEGDGITLDNYSAVWDVERERQLMTIRPTLVLPIGAEIELRNPIARATVVGIRLIHTGRTGHIRIDARVPEGFWRED